MSRRQPTPEEDAELDAQGRQLLEQIRAMREREAAQRAWLQEQVAKGLAEREEERPREEDR